MKYFKQLDSIRGIAVIMVIYSHWLENWRIGQIGVNIFFTLSGFLITRILLLNRKDAENLNLSKSELIKNFYVKRVLRIFPIYYLTVLVILPLVNYLQIPRNIHTGYYLTFTANIKYFICECFDGPFTHLWSLAVEEQFYLVWPWLILFINRKYLLPVIYGAIFIGVMAQFYWIDDRFSRFLTFQCFDAFGIGALTSWYSLQETKIRKFSLVAMILGSLYLNLSFIISHSFFNDLYFMPDRTVTALFTAAIMAHIVSNNGVGLKFIDDIMNHKWLVFCGKISYGLYLYHNFVPEIINRRIVNIYINPHLPSIFMKYEFWFKLAENVLIVSIMAIVSYYIIEKPFLKLKGRFEIKQQV